MTPPPSARLTFRSWAAEDTGLAKALWCDPEVTHYFGGAMTREQAHDRLHTERECESRLGIQYWPMFLRKTGEFAGCAGLRQWQMDPGTIEAGVHLMRSAWGLRLGEEALRAALAHGFDTLGLPMIVAGHGIGHDNSQKLLQRVGFGYTHNAMWGTKAIEVRMYSITRAMWHLTERQEKSA
ncbi:MAG: GNAT family N-acetyltransferase [Terracidiphilus sp.]